MLLLFIFFIIIPTLLLLIYSILIIHYRKLWLQIPMFEYSSIPDGLPFISVVIPVRNEAIHIDSLLQSLQQQNYPASLFEIILINDHSTDATCEQIAPYLNQQVRLLHLKDYLKGTPTNAYKKKAITYGISESKGTLIVTTDADCVFDPKWLQTIGVYSTLNRVEMIVMPVGMKVGMNPFKIFQSLDFLSLQGITGAAAGHKLHSMCNGANLAYTKKGFESVQGFEGIDEIASGDDMLLMQKFREKYPNGIAYLKSSRVVAQTSPEKSLSDFFRQRIRWASKARKYRDKSLFPVLLLVFCLNLSLCMMGIVAYFQSGNELKVYIEMLAIYLLIKTSVELFFLMPVAAFFKTRRHLWWFPFFQPFHIVYTVTAGFFGNIGSYSWKDRKVH